MAPIHQGNNESRSSGGEGKESGNKGGNWKKDNQGQKGNQGGGGGNKKWNEKKGNKEWKGKNYVNIGV